MEKPTVLVKEETKEKLINILNECKLPPFIIEPILIELLEQAHEAARVEFESAKNEYYKKENIKKN